MSNDGLNTQNLITRNQHTMKNVDVRSSIITEDIFNILSSTLVDWEQFTHRRILITGITGLIGSYLFETLSELAIGQNFTKIEIFGLARNGAAAKKRFAHLLKHSFIHLVVHDITAPPPALPNFDFIIHAASEASPKYFLNDPIGTIQANVFGTQQLLEISRHAGSRFLFLSSGTVYGHTIDTKQATTEIDFGPYDPLDSRACYAESKRMAETLCANYFQQFGVETVIARISHTYGPGVELDDGRVFGDFVADAVAARNIRVTGRGDDSRPFLYVADATLALLLLLQKGRGGNAYNLGAEEEITISELAELIATLSGLQTTFAQTGDSDHSPSTAVRSSGHFAIEKIKALGWQPLTDPRTGFSRTLAYYGVHTPLRLETA